MTNDGNFFFSTMKKGRNSYPKYQKAVIFFNNGKRQEFYSKIAKGTNLDKRQEFFPKIQKAVFF